MIKDFPSNSISLSIFKFLSSFENLFILYSLSVAYLIFLFAIVAFLEIKYPISSYFTSSFLFKLFILLSSSFNSSSVLFCLFMHVIPF